MPEDIPASNVIEAAADLGRRDAERTPESYDLIEESSIVVARVRDDENIQVHDLESHLATPRQPRGAAVVHDPGDFANYVLRLGDRDTTTVWADVNNGKVTAVIDDHRNETFAGWRRHTVALSLQPDPDWQAWIAADKVVMAQAEFAEFLEQNLHAVLSPPAADLYEVAVSLQATRSASFRSGVRLNNGDTQVAYDEQTTASAGSKGNLEIPDSFTVKLAPFAYTDPVELVAKLRYRIKEGRLLLGFVLIRPHVQRQNAFASIVGKLREQLRVSDDAVLPVFLGMPPAPVVPVQ